MLFKYLLPTIIVASLALNAYFIHDYFTDEPPVVVNAGVVERPVKVVEIKTEYKVVTRTINRPTLDIKDAVNEEKILLERLENTTPVVKTEPVRVVQNDKKQWVFPGTIKGEITLDYLKYDMELKLKPEIVYKKKDQLPFAVVLQSYYKINPIGLQYSLGVALPVTIPIIDMKIYGGIGLHMLSLSSGFQLFENSFVHLGVGYTYDRNIAPFVGIGFNF